MNLFELHDLLESEGVIFSFSGTITQEIVCSLAETVEQELSSSGEKSKMVSKIFAILTEQMQNVMSYAKDKIKKGENIFESAGLVLVGFDEKKQKYFVASANKMEAGDKETLLSKLEKINSLDETGLKAYYKELRRSGNEKHGRGAGLGFLEMAKKASEPIQYSLQEMNDETCLFEIKVYI